MSRRHRTTAKMHRVSDKGRETKPTPTEIDMAGTDTAAVDATADATATANAAGTHAAVLERGAVADVLKSDDTLTVESLGRYLATEASLRGESEQRTSAVLARYLKLTLAMACLNLVVAAVCVAALLHLRDKAPVVIAAPPVVAPAPLPAAPPAPPEKTVVAEPAALTAEPPVPPAEPRAVSRPAKIPLLGPLLAPPKPAPAARSRATRVASKPAPSALAAPITLARNADEEDTSTVHAAVERW